MNIKGHDMEISWNYGDLESSRKTKRPIYVGKNGASMGISLEQAEFLVENLPKFIEELKKKPVHVPFQVGDVVELHNNRDKSTNFYIQEDPNKVGNVILHEFPSNEYKGSDSLTPEEWVIAWGKVGVEITKVFRPQPLE